MKMVAKTARVKIWEELLKVARRIPNSAGSFQSLSRIMKAVTRAPHCWRPRDMYKNAKVIFHNAGQ